MKKKLEVENLVTPSLNMIRLEGDLVDRPGSGSRPHSAKQQLLQEDLIDVTPGLRFTKRSAHDLFREYLSS